MTEAPRGPDAHTEYAAANEKFHAVTGQFLRNWADLEVALAECLAALLRTDGFRARIIFAGIINPRTKITLVEMMAACYLDDPDKAEFEAILKKVTKSANNRNLLVHAGGGVNVDDPSYVILVRDVFDQNNGNFEFVKDKSVPMTSVVAWPKMCTDLIQALGPWPARIRQVVRADR